MRTRILGFDDDFSSNWVSCQGCRFCEREKGKGREGLGRCTATNQKINAGLARYCDGFEKRLIYSFKASGNGRVQSE